MSTETDSSVFVPDRARTLTIWAGRSLVAIALIHAAFFAAVSWDHIPGWFAGELWAAPNLDAPMSQSEAYFWALLGSFAVPLLLLGALITRSAQQGSTLPGYVTWTIAAWVLACALIMEPSGFPLGLIPLSLLFTAEVMRRRR
jgi:hypothetical protein